MATSMRAQVSLMFDDADLFENFITPCKEERRLNGIIIKCLSAYYRNEQVRGMIEGASLGEVSDSEEVTSTQSICDNIRASLIMQDFLVEELKQTVETGTEDITDILSQTNKRAEDRGVGSSYQTKSGSTILQLEAPKQKIAPQQTSPAAPAQAAPSGDLASILCQAVLLLAKDSDNPQVTALLQQAGIGTPVVEPQVQTETVRQKPAAQVLSSTPVQTPNFVEPEPVVEFESQNDFESSPEPVKTTAEKAEPEDASDAMADLLASL